MYLHSLTMGCNQRLNHLRLFHKIGPSHAHLDRAQVHHCGQQPGRPPRHLHGRRCDISSHPASNLPLSIPRCALCDHAHTCNGPADASHSIASHHRHCRVPRPPRAAYLQRGTYIYCVTCVMIVEIAFIAFIDGFLGFCVAAVPVRQQNRLHSGAVGPARGAGCQHGQDYEGVA